MNCKWIITFDTDPYDDEPKFETYVYLNDADAMKAIFEHNYEWTVIDVSIVSNFKGDLD